jgi:hypothetical protein
VKRIGVDNDYTDVIDDILSDSNLPSSVLLVKDGTPGIDANIKAARDRGDYKPPRDPELTTIPAGIISERIYKDDDEVEMYELVVNFGSAGCPKYKARTDDLKRFL